METIWGAWAWKMYWYRPIQSTTRTINNIPVAENNAYTCAAVTKSEHIIVICLLCDAISLPYLTKHTKVIVRPDKQLFHHEYVIGAWSLEGTGWVQDWNDDEWPERPWLDVVPALAVLWTNAVCSSVSYSDVSIELTATAKNREIRISRHAKTTNWPNIFNSNISNDKLTCQLQTIKFYL